MESDFSPSDNESSTGSSGLSTGTLLAFPVNTRFRCSGCPRLFSSERALIQHQMGSCNFARKALSFLQRFKFAQPAIPPPPTPPLLPPSPLQWPYYQRATMLAPAPLNLSLTLGNTVAEGSATHDPFGGRGDPKPSLKTVDLLSLIDHTYAARARSVQFPGPSVYGRYGGNGGRDAAAVGGSSGKEELDLELKL